MATSLRPDRGGTGPLLWIAVCAALLLSACSSVSLKESPSGSSGGGAVRGGGYYKDDGPPSAPPANLDQVPDPLPGVEPLASGANKPYVVLGKRYAPMTSISQPYRMTGIASWYGRKFHGARTSNGEIYDMYAMTAAHTTLPIPSYARVTRTATGKSVIVRVNDRGPFHDDRIIDLSYTAAYKLGLLAQGSGEVTVELLAPDEIARIRAERGTMLASSGSGAAPAADSAPVAETVPVPQAAPEQATQVRELPPPAPAAAPAQYASAAPAGSAPVAVPSSAAVPVAAAPQAGIFLQIGAFSGTRNAEDLVARLRAQAPDVGDAVRIVDADNLHKVHVGPYPNRESALTAARDLQARANVTPVIVVR